MSVVTTSLPYPKIDKIPIPASEDPRQFVQATDWNTVCAVLDSVRSNISGGGDLIPDGDKTRTIGAASTGRYVQVYTVKVNSGGTDDLLFQTNNFDRLLLGRTTTNTLTSGVANGGSAVGNAVDTFSSYVTAGAKILSVRNATVEKAAFMLDGGLLAPSVGPSATVQHTVPGGSSSTLAILDAVQTFTKNQDITEVNLGSISATTVATDSSLSSNFKAALTGACTLGAPTGSPPAGRIITYALTNSSGTATLAFNATFKFPGGVAPTLSTGSGARDIFTVRFNGTSWDLIAQQAFA